MKTVNRLIVLAAQILMAGLTLSGGILLVSTMPGECNDPRISEAHANHPDNILRSIIERSGGLPNEMIERSALSGRNPLEWGNGVFQFDEVANWRISSTDIQKSLGRLLDDDPTFQLRFSAEITYTDGTQSQLDWESWRYGRVVCPFIISMGSGPHGYVSIRPK